MKSVLLLNWKERATTCELLSNVHGLLMPKNIWTWLVLLPGSGSSKPILLKDATPREAVLILVQAACILAIVAVLEGVGRWRPRL